MNRKDDFKKFVSTHPDLVNVVAHKKKSWQDLFEVFDLYGNDETAWQKYLDSLETMKRNTANTASSSISELTKLFKNINIESVQKYIETAQKAIGIVQELTGGSVGASVSSSGPTSPRPINKIFED